MSMKRVADPKHLAVSGSNSPRWQGYWASDRSVPSDRVPLALIEGWRAGTTKIGSQGPSSRWVHLSIDERTACNHVIRATARAVEWVPRGDVACPTCLERWEEAIRFSKLSEEQDSATLPLTSAL